MGRLRIETSLKPQGKHIHHLVSRRFCRGRVCACDIFVSRSRVINTSESSVSSPAPL